MKTNIKATNLELTQDLSDYVNKKLSGIEKFIHAKDPESVHTYVEVEKTTSHHQTGETLYRAEVNIKTDMGYFRAEHTGASPEAAIDIMKDEIVRELTASVSKERTLTRRGQAALKKLFKRFYR